MISHTNFFLPKQVNWESRLVQDGIIKKGSDLWKNIADCIEKMTEIPRDFIPFLKVPTRHIFFTLKDNFRTEDSRMSTTFYLTHSMKPTSKFIQYYRNDKIQDYFLLQKPIRLPDISMYWKRIMRRIKECTFIYSKLKNVTIMQLEQIICRYLLQTNGFYRYDDDDDILMLSICLRDFDLGSYFLRLDKRTAIWLQRTKI